jgi:16S rRNA (cytosine1402-N4)-methyltransferase
MAKHTPVLLHESITNLELRPGDIFLDGTLGSGGHSSFALESVGPSLTIIGLDRDTAALERSRERLASSGAKVHLFEETFRNMDRVLEDLELEGVDAILLDLGISSDQIENSGRGFSFQKDEPLLMTMKERPGEDDLTAAKVLNSFEEESLEVILRGFGEERYSRKIARAIVERRDIKPFETTFDLVEVINGVVPASYRRGRINPATRTFQALRIAVNEELIALEEGLEKGFKFLNKDGRFAVITFHSLEDRIVKNFFRNRVKEDKAEFINKKPIVPTEEELEQNRRARSAKLRVIRKL